MALQEALPVGHPVTHMSPAHPWEAHFFSRAVLTTASRQAWWLEARLDVHAGEALATSSAHRPAAAPLRAALLDVWRVGQPVTVPHDRVPALSVLGPGGPGPLYAICSVKPQRLQFLVKVAAGCLSLFVSPCTPPQLRQTRDDNDADYSALDRVSMKRTPNKCMLCNTDREDPWHLTNLCPGSAEDSALRSRRAEARTSARHMLLELTGSIAAADRSLEALAEGARLAMAAMRWESPEGHWLLFRLVGVLPWPAAAAAPGHHAVAALGALFDACRLPKRALVPIARVWVSWSVKHSHALGKARVAAYSSPSVVARYRRQADADMAARGGPRAAHDNRRASV